MPKLDIKNSRSSKLNQKNKESIEVIRRINKKTNPTSVRLTESEKNIVLNILKKLELHSSRKVSESDIIRILIHFGSNMDMKSIIEYYKETL